MMRHLRITIDGRPYDVVVEDVTDAAGGSSTVPVQTPNAPAPVGRPPASTPIAGTGAAGAVSHPTPAAGGPDDRTAPLAGVVLEINVAIGDEVAIDDPLVILEAMKMKTVIGAHKAGTVSAIHVKAGDSVDSEQPLVTIS
ncbi:oxaloacetate decarboxylase alpha subunit [Rhodovulum sp. PH10]|uniref:biotin/lipoyl-containing protein n=1 Tax=Rhodovulum sp. PH10 TaxID=1187851 RepID=UPI00027C25B7|nr:biotin/lipoyl-containing protein [Rhodovulum sp. PH10]EJW13720.1 oxaloacetate decarboxylase alpha subunit [Rhodovulum sp. PH10]